MRKSFKYIVSAFAVSLMALGTTSAQSMQDAVSMSKTATPNKDAAGNITGYTLTLETYAKGSSVTIQAEGNMPVDMQIVYDLSGKMNAGNAKPVDALQSASVSFVDILLGQGSENRIGFVQTPNSNAAPSNWLSIKNTKSVSELRTQFGSINATSNSSMYPSQSLTTAKNDLIANSGENRMKAIVFISDGHIANNAESTNVINVASQIKASGIPIYTIYLPGQQSIDSPHLTSIATDANHKLTPTNITPEAIMDLFKQIQAEVQGSASYQFDVNKTEIRDFITPEFVIPDGASNVRVYTEEVKPGVAYPDYANLEWVNRTTFTGAVTVANNQVTVKGFDFTGDTNWVGPNKNNKNQITNWRGKKLVIEIDIVPNEQNPGDGIISTNTVNSGIYIDGTEVLIYEQPKAIASTTSYLQIRKEGLKKGESAIFQVSDNKYGQSYTVMLSNTIADNAPVTASIGVRYLMDESIKDINVLKGMSAEKAFVDFTVTELTDWTWHNADTESATQIQNFAYNFETLEPIVFTFKNPRKEVEFNYDETNYTK